MNLNDFFYLPRASRYANPLNGADRLPLPYGDLTDGAAGIWRLPCIDTVNYVYAFAASEVLSVANGNSVSIYKDNVLVDPANYTFDELNDYEGEGEIATVTFSADQGNSVITARGKGICDGADLLTNIIDIVDDFLTVRNDWSTADYEATAKATASQVFTAQGYAAAGVIAADAKYWQILQQMMGSFLGSVYLDAEGLLVLEIDTNAAVATPDGYVSGSKLTVAGTQRADNLINRCPCNYGYNQVTNEFSHYTDDAADGDLVSQAMFGACKPATPYQFYWCRDLTSVQAVQAIIIDKFSMPLWELELTDQSYVQLGLDVGKVVAATMLDLYDTEGQQMINQLVRITGVQPDPRNGRIVLEAHDTGQYLLWAHLADGTYLADGSIKAGGDRDTRVY